MIDSSQVSLERTAPARKHNRILFYIGMAMFLGSIFTRNILRLSVPVVIILAIASLTALVSDRDEILALAVSCIPTGSAFQYKYFVLVIIVVYIMKFGKDIKYKSGLVPLVLMMIWELAHAIGYTFSIYEFLRNFTELILCALIMMSEKRKIDYALIIRTLSVSTICMLSIVLLNLLRETGYDFAAIFTGSYRFGVGNVEAENYGVNYNANGVGSMANMCTVGLLQLGLAKKQKILDYVMIAVLLLFGVLSMSRALLVVLAIVLLLYIFAGNDTFGSKLKKILISVTVVVGITLIVAKFMPTVLENFIARFEVDDISNGRVDLLVFYNEHIFMNLKNMLFGVGLQDLMGKVSDIHGEVANVCHNGMQELVVCWGFIGAAFFVAFIADMFRMKGLDFKRRLVNFIPIIVLFVTIQSGQLIRSGTTLLNLILCYISLNCCLEEDKNYE